jgi:hypothetical protein
VAIPGNDPRARTAPCQGIHKAGATRARPHFPELVRYSHNTVDAVPEDRYCRVGIKMAADPKAVVGVPFIAEVSAPHYREFWTDEIQILHNPNARYALPFETLLSASHHFIKDGQLRSVGPEGFILSS